MDAVRLFLAESPVKQCSLPGLVEGGESLCFFPVIPIGFRSNKHVLSEQSDLSGLVAQAHMLSALAVT
jgi:hypothetical protein